MRLLGKAGMQTRLQYFILWDLLRSKLISPVSMFCSFKESIRY